MNKKTISIIVCSVIVIIIASSMLFLLLSNNNKTSKTYSVTFETDGGTFIETQVVEEGEKVKKPIDPIKEGYMFVGWLHQGKTYDFNLNVTSNLKLIAKWVEVNDEVETFIIKFETDGGTTIDNQVVEKGNKVEKPIDPTKNGYKFIGWILNDKNYDFEAGVYENFELKAKWEKVSEDDDKTNNNVNNNDNKPSNPTTTVERKYTVTFDSAGGSSVSSQTVKEGGKVTKPSDPSRKGYIFVGWTLNGNVYNFDLAVNNDVKLVAKWNEKEKAKFLVTFDSNGGTSVNSQTIIEGEKVEKPSNPTREGYNFDGWLLNGNIYDFSSSVNNNIKLVAKWKQKSYSVVADKADNTSTFSRKLSVYADGEIITVKEIQYSDGVKICSGSNPNVNYYAIEGETTLRLVLSNDTVVTASLTIVQ